MHTVGSIDGNTVVPESGRIAPVCLKCNRVMSFAARVPPLGEQAGATIYRCEECGATASVPIEPRDHRSQ